MNVKKGTNRVNSQGAFTEQIPSDSSGYFSAVIKAGATIVYPVIGSSFYFTVATAPLQVQISPNGVSNSYVQGTGMRIENSSFTALQIQNPNALPVTFQIFTGFNDFIDKRLIQNNSTQNIIKFTSDAHFFPDASNTTFIDQSGQAWLAIQRISFTFQTFSGFPSIEFANIYPNITQAGNPIYQISGADGVFNISCSGPLSVTTANVNPGNYQGFEIYQAIMPNAQNVAG